MSNPLEHLPTSPDTSKREKLVQLSESLGTAQKTSIVERWKQVTDSTEAREALLSLARLGVNTVFTVADMFPGAGEVMEPALGVYKTASRVIPALRKFDPTKDIGLAETFAIQTISAPAELVTFGTSPTYLINSLRQTWADYKAGNFTRAKDAIGYLITGKQDYYSRLQESISKLDQAAGVFKK